MLWNGTPTLTGLQAPASGKSSHNHASIIVLPTSGTFPVNLQQSDLQNEFLDFSFHKLMANSFIVKNFIFYY